MDALEAVGKDDPESGAYVIALEKHYQKLEVCSGK